MRVAVIGASLVGPSIAEFLAQQGIRDITIYEALRRPHSQSGGVMGLRPETLQLFRNIGIRSTQVRALGDESVSAYDMTGPGRFEYRGQSMFPGTTTSWDALYATLRGRHDVKYAHELTAITADGRRFLLTFRNGHTDEADVVLFADGRKSFGRDALDSRPLRYNGYVIWRGLAKLPSDLPVRPHGFMRFYDPDAGRLFSITGQLLHNGLSYWELSHNLSAMEWARIANGVPTQHAYMTPRQVHDDARALIDSAADRLPTKFRDMLADSEVSGIPVNDVAFPTRAIWRTEQGATAALLGDALIPVRLQVGAGLNQGIVQAASLADALSSRDAASVDKWESHALERLGPIVELGRSRAHRINLGSYIPVHSGLTAAPADGGAFDEPKWVTA